MFSSIIYLSKIIFEFILREFPIVDFRVIQWSDALASLYGKIVQDACTLSHFQIKYLSNRWDRRHWLHKLAMSKIVEKQFLRPFSIIFSRSSSKSCDSSGKVYDSILENAINKQTNRELQASHDYFSLGQHFLQTKVSRYGFGGFNTKVTNCTFITSYKYFRIFLETIIGWAWTRTCSMRVPA